MKQEMNEKSRKDLIAYRLKRAEETLEEAKFTASGGFYNAAINRLYYSSYYAVLAALLKDSISANSHAGVKAMFHLNYILPGKFPREIGKYYSVLMASRQSGDYEDFTYYDKDDFIRLLAMAEQLLVSIRNYVLS